MRTHILAGNWKMNVTQRDCVDLSGALRMNIRETELVEVVVCPPFPYLPIVRDILSDSPVKLGAQDVCQYESGAYTGEVSAAMLAEFTQYVIVGHSERRSMFGDSDATVAGKTHAASAQGLIPILCVGENADARSDGKAESFVRGQVRSALQSHESDARIVVAYEPIWAIGTGNAATVEQIEYITESIREELDNLLGDDVAQSTPILYGGSANPSNIGELAASGSIDGALVGSASLNAEDFIAMVNAQVDAVAQTQ